MREIRVEAPGQQMQRSGQAEALCPAHAADVPLEALAPSDAIACVIRRSFGRVALCTDLLQEAAEISRQLASLIHGCGSADGGTEDDPSLLLS